MLHDISRHVDVDLPGVVDKQRVHVHCFCLPSEVKRIDGYTVAAPSWSWIESLETKGLGLGRVENLRV
jgi:hypothetical protein